MRRHLAAALSLAMLVVTGALAQTSPLEGTWKLNVAKSKYSPNPAPKSQTIKFERVEGGFRFTTDGVSTTGETSRTVTMQKSDGSDAPIEGGTTQGATRSLRRIDDRTYDHNDKLNGKPTVARRIVISPDGRTLTITMSGNNAQGEPVNNMAVYEKQ